MNVEQAIREKHAFRNRLQKFLAIAVIMTNDEIEIALGRLVDMLGASQDQGAKLDIAVKGTVLKAFFDLRQAGAVAQNTKRRYAFDIQDAKSEYARMKHKEAVQKWKADGHLEKWRQQPFLKRLISAKPFSPTYWDIYLTLSQKDELFIAEHYLLNKLTSFELVPKGAPAPEVTPEDVKLLSMQSQ